MVWGLDLREDQVLSWRDCPTHSSPTWPTLTLWGKKGPGGPLGSEQMAAMLSSTGLVLPPPPGAGGWLVWEVPAVPALTTHLAVGLSLP